MVIRRGYDRLVNLSDAVIAIAVTLLILPLVDAAGNIGDASPGQFLVDHEEQLFLFALSFVVIADFWLIHHKLYRAIEGYTITLVWVNFVWLLTIVFLPFPTELLGQSSGSNTVTSALYIGTMVVTTYAGLVAQYIIVKTPEMQLENIRGTILLSPAVFPAIAMTAALIVAVTVPGVGLWALVILFVSGWVERYWVRRSRARLRDQAGRPVA
ncbi:TMEM175 family protein [Subtercola sp. YIM 133946]|uniref:TMEM175 family protein n=1 Tax=Subtercola sp. YIM 133946 TaxID=3118909 RepID=UPI002F948788